MLNNPLNATEPSGFFLDKLWDEIRPFLGAIVAVGLCVWNACAGSAGPIAWGIQAGGTEGQEGRELTEEALWAALEGEAEEENQGDDHD